MKILDKIITFILNIILFLMIIIFLLSSYYLFQLKIQKKEYANIFGYTFFYVVTGSMEPSINIGDVIIVKLKSDFHVGDIIVYKEGHNFITHRLIDENADMYLTKGDANNAADEWVDKSLVIGKVAFLLPKVFVIKEVLLTPKVLMPLIITIVLFSLAYSYKRKDEKK